jgi:hypothetical protein
LFGGLFLEMLFLGYFFWFKKKGRKKKGGKRFGMTGRVWSVSEMY